MTLSSLLCPRCEGAGWFPGGRRTKQRCTVCGGTGLEPLSHREKARESLAFYLCGEAKLPNTVATLLDNYVKLSIAERVDEGRWITYTADRDLEGDE